MPSFSTTLEQAIHSALALANSRRHELATLEHLLLALIDKGTISGKIAKEVFDEMFATGKAAEEIVRAKGLTQITDTEAIATTLDEIIAANPKEWERLKAGQEQLVKFFVGQVMRVTKGRANPQVVNDLLKERLQ